MKDQWRRIELGQFPSYKPALKQLTLEKPGALSSEERQMLGPLVGGAPEAAPSARRPQARATLAAPRRTARTAQEAMEYIFAAYGLQAGDADRVRALGREAAEDSGSDDSRDSSDDDW